jgi:hypothetical protein
MSRFALTVLFAVAPKLSELRAGLNEKSPGALRPETRCARIQVA